MELNVRAPTEFGVEEEGSEETGTRLRAEPSLSLEEVAARFPQLEILELLGRGGMGVVYKARQKQLNRLIALKILAPDKERNAQFAERFIREAQALALLNHPSIVAVHDFGQVDGLYYLLLEYVEGLSLRQLLKSGRLAPEEALALVPRVCEALQYAHERGVVHRDIKPENILLDENGQVKIADFGIAKLTQSQKSQPALTQERQVIGTPHYMAPEQVEHPDRVDHRADIYSLGVVFYEMLTGELPLGKFPPPSQKASVDARLDRVVLGALEKEPERRYQQASAVKDDVETIVTMPADSSARAALNLGSAPLEARDGHQPRRMTVSRAVMGARWTARVLGTLMLGGFILMLLMEGMMPLGYLGTRERLASAAWGLTLLGFALGWKFEGTAALLVGTGWAFFPMVMRLQPRLLLSPVPLYVIVAALYGYCWWASHGRRTRIVTCSSAVILALLTASSLAASLLKAHLKIPTRDPQASRNLIDLTPYYNGSLGENWMNPRDTRNHLGELPRGVQRLGETEFDLRGLIQVEQECRRHPPRVSGIAVGQQCRRLRFLHAACNAALLEDGLEIGQYVVHLADGTQYQIPLVLGRELVDWQIQRRNTEAYVTAWEGENPWSRQLRKKIRLFKTTWENPRPEVEVRTVDFVAACPGPCPFLVALTAE
jgi:tRNA A-37 threonylcarbamoyl transferase component Bud32